MICDKSKALSLSLSQGSFGLVTGMKSVFGMLAGFWATKNGCESWGFGQGAQRVWAAKCEELVDVSNLNRTWLDSCEILVFVRLDEI